MNLRMESQIFLPQSTALTIEVKLSLRRIISAAYFATYVPVIPIANPTSAFFKAGASLVPSPVTATTCPLSLRPVTKAYLSSGLDLAKTLRFSLSLSNSSPFAMVSTLKSLPVFSCYFESLAQSHFAVRHFLQTTPPISLIKSIPYITILLSPGWIIPISQAIALAVIKLSPVTIRIVIPAILHFCIASGTYYLGTSLTPIIPRHINSDF